MDSVTNKRFSFLVKLAYYAVILIAVFLFFKYVFIWVAPFLLGLIVTLIVEPATQFLVTKVKLNRRISGFITTICFWLVMGLIISYLLWMLVSEVYSLFKMAPAIATGTREFIKSFSDKLSIEYDRLPPDVKNAVQSSLNNITVSVSNFISGVIDNLFNIVSRFMMSLPKVIFFISTAIISSCFIACDYPRIRKFVNMQIPSKHYATVVHVRNFLSNTIFKLIKAYSVIMLITFCLLFAGFRILGIDYALILAMLIALVDILPVIGCSAITIPWGIILIFMDNFKTGIGLLILTLIILIVRQISEPKIIGHHLGLYPLVSLITMYIGLVSFGFTGMIVLPLAVIFLLNMQELGHIKIWKTTSDFKNKPHPSQKDDGKT